MSDQEITIHKTVSIETLTETGVKTRDDLGNALALALVKQERALSRIISIVDADMLDRHGRDTLQGKAHASAIAEIGRDMDDLGKLVALVYDFPKGEIVTDD